MYLLREEGLIMNNDQLHALILEAKDAGLHFFVYPGGQFTFQPPGSVKHNPELMVRLRAVRDELAGFVYQGKGAQ